MKKCPLLPLHAGNAGMGSLLARDCMGDECQLWWFCRGPEEEEALKPRTATARG